MPHILSAENGLFYVLCTYVFVCVCACVCLSLSVRVDPLSPIAWTNALPILQWFQTPAGVI